MPVVPFVPLAGRLTARVFANPRAGFLATLLFDIEIPLQPFEFGGELQKTAVRLDFIELPVSDWRQLQNREFRFPVNPQPGYIDGSVYLGHAHNPCDVTRIRFGPVAGRSLQAELDVRFNFEYEGPAELGKPAATWTVPLSFDPEQLDRAVAEARRVGATSVAE
jgi:hypothetical protein